MSCMVCNRRVAARLREYEADLEPDGGELAPGMREERWAYAARIDCLTMEKHGLRCPACGHPSLRARDGSGPRMVSSLDSFGSATKE
jgi:hypothetical protein